MISLASSHGVGRAQYRWHSAWDRAEGAHYGINISPLSIGMVEAHGWGGHISCSCNYETAVVIQLISVKEGQRHRPARTTPGMLAMRPANYQPLRGPLVSPRLPVWFGVAAVICCRKRHVIKQVQNCLFPLQVFCIAG